MFAKNAKKKTKKSLSSKDGTTIKQEDGGSGVDEVKEGIKKFLPITKEDIEEVKKSQNIRLFYTDKEWYEPLSGIKGLSVLASNCKYAKQRHTFNIAIIYMIRCLITNEVNVGKAENGQRFSSYQVYVNNDYKYSPTIRGQIAKSLKKYGMENHTTQILEIVRNTSMVDQKEMNWIWQKNETEILMNDLSKCTKDIPVLPQKEWDKVVKRFFKNAKTVDKLLISTYTTNKRGYCTIGIQGTTYSVHRVAWVIKQRKTNPTYQIPDNLSVRHMDRNGITVPGNCIDIRYLELGTGGDNAKDKVSKEKWDWVNSERDLFRKYKKENPFEKGYIKQRAKELNMKSKTLNAILNNRMYYDPKHIPPGQRIGITYHKEENITKRYQASLKIHSKYHKYLGVYTKIEYAMEVVDECIVQLREHGWHQHTNKERGLY